MLLIFSYFKHVLALPLSFFDSRKTGEILSRMEDSQKVRQAISEAVVSVIMDILMLAVVGVALFFQSSQLFWIALATVPISSVNGMGLFKKICSRVPHIDERIFRSTIVFGRSY